MSVGVWMVSGRVLRVSGDVLVPNLLANKLHQVKILIHCLFFRCPVLHKKMPMPGGVWIVSEGVWTESECVGIY